MLAKVRVVWEPQVRVKLAGAEVPWAAWAGLGLWRSRCSVEVVEAGVLR